MNSDRTLLQVLCAGAVLIAFAIALLVLRRLLVWIINRFPLVNLLYLLFRRPTLIIVSFLLSRTSYNLLISHIIPNCLRPRGPNPIDLEWSLLDKSACQLIKGAVFLVSLLVLEKMKLLLLILLLIVGEVIFILIGGRLSSRSSEELRF